MVSDIKRYIMGGAVRLDGDWVLYDEAVRKARADLEKPQDKP